MIFAYDRRKMIVANRTGGAVCTARFLTNILGRLMSPGDALQYIPEGNFPIRHFAATYFTTSYFGVVISRTTSCIRAR